MADEATPQAVDETLQAPVDETTAGSQPETKPEDSSVPSIEEAGEPKEGEAKAEPPASSGDKKPSETLEDKPESKPLSRRSAAFRIQQLTKENKALKEQLKPQEQDDWGEPLPDDKPDIEALVAKEVEKRLTPVISETSKAADDAELNDLFAGLNSERPKFEPQIRKLWNLPQYKDVSAQDLFNMLRGKEMNKIIDQAKTDAVEEFKKAGKEAKDSSASGQSNATRNSKTEKTAWDLSDKEFQDTVNKVRAGG